MGPRFLPGIFGSWDPEWAFRARQRGDLGAENGHNRVPSRNLHTSQTGLTELKPLHPMTGVQTDPGPGEMCGGVVVEAAEAIAFAFRAF